MKPKDFRHKINVVVRFNEIDMLGVCNNAVYITYMEHARLQYMKSTGFTDGKKLFPEGKLYFVVRNEVNYYDHARYDDQLNIYTRISYIKNSSFGFEHLIEKGDRIIADGKGVIVQVDSRTRKSVPLPEEFYKKISEFEPGVKIIKDDVDQGNQNFQF
jgi:acyl-CoA thioester hydrolase